MCQNESERDDNILLTSSSDHTIRLWSKVLENSICMSSMETDALNLLAKLMQTNCLTKSYG